MQSDDEVHRLRADLYRPGADAASVQRYEAARDAAVGPAPAPEPIRRHGRTIARTGLVAAGVSVVAVLALAALLAPRPPVRAPAALARGALSATSEPRWSSWPPTADAQRAALALGLRDAAAMPGAVRRFPELIPMRGRPVVASGTSSTASLALDGFAARVEPFSEVVAVWRCGSTSGSYRLRLHTLAQKDASIVPALLATRSGRCSAEPQTVRYRPLRGVVPTAADLQAPRGSVLTVLLTGPAS